MSLSENGGLTPQSWYLTHRENEWKWVALPVELAVSLCFLFIFRETHIYIYAYIDYHIYTYIYIHIYIHIYTYIYVYTCIWLHIYIYTHVYLIRCIQEPDPFVTSSIFKFIQISGKWSRVKQTEFLGRNHQQVVYLGTKYLAKPWMGKFCNFSNFSGTLSILHPEIL